MQPEIVLETERLRLTSWVPDQIDDLLALHGDPKVTQYLDAEGKPWSRDKAVARLAVWAENFADQRMGKLRLIRKTDGEFIGRAGFGLYEPTGEPEIGYALFPAHWGQGYAYEAACGLRDWIFGTTAWDHFIGLADVRNAASLKVLRRIGMVPTQVETEPSGLRAQFFILNKDGLNV